MNVESAGRQRLQCNEREVLLCCDSDEHSSCWGKRSVDFVGILLPCAFWHLTAQRALELEMMLLPLARRRWLPCHTAYAGRHKSYSVNKAPPHSATSHSFCVLIFPINTVLSSSIFTLPTSHFSFVCLLLIISVWVFLLPFSSSEVLVNRKVVSVRSSFLLFLVPLHVLLICEVFSFSFFFSHYLKHHPHFHLTLQL